MRKELGFDFRVGAIASALLVLAFVFSATGIPRWIPPAPLAVAGIPSPLSGMTRSIVALAGGDLRAAFGWHPLGPPLFVSLLAASVVCALTLARGRRIGVLDRFLSRRAVWACVAAAFTLAWIRQIVALPG